MATTNDLQIYQNGTWITPSEVSVYNNSAWTGCDYVYVRKNGAWVQSWPPIQGNVTPPSGDTFGNMTYGFDPNVIANAQNKVLLLDRLANEYSGINEGMNIGYAMIGTSGRDYTQFWPGGAPIAHFNDQITIFGSDGGNGMIKRYRRLGGSLLPYATAQGTYAPPSPAWPSVIDTYQSTTTKFNKASTYNSYSYFNYNNSIVGSAVAYRGLVMVGDGGKITITNSHYIDPETNSVYSTTDGFAPTLNFYDIPSGQTENFHDMIVSDYTYSNGISTFARIEVFAVGQSGKVAKAYIDCPYKSTITTPPNAGQITYSVSNWSYGTQDLNSMVNIYRGGGISIFVVGDGGKIYADSALIWPTGYSNPVMGQALAPWPSPTTNNLNAVAAGFNNKTNTNIHSIVAVGDNGTIISYKNTTLISENGGLFQVRTSGTTANLTSVVSVGFNGTESIYYAFGEGGIMLKSMDSGTTWVAETSAWTDIITSSASFY